MRGAFADGRILARINRELRIASLVLRHHTAFAVDTERSDGRVALSIRAPTE